MDPLTLAQLAQKPAYVPKHKKRGRGRPPAAAAAMASSVPPSAVSLPPTALEGIPINDAAAAAAVKDSSQKQAESAADLTHGGEPNEEDEPAEDGQDTAVKEEPVKEEDDDGDDSGKDHLEKNNEKSTGPVSIPATHPLFGVWKGSFMVKAMKGPGEELIHETLFFYTTLGAAPMTDFKDLPPEPTFPFSLLKKQILSPAATKDAPTTTTTTMTTNGDIKADSEMTPDETTTTLLDVDDVNPVEEASSNFGLTATAFDTLCKKILIGFGRNSIGRFSVAAMFDESTGELHAEKKYMSTKNAIKRGRRSHMEYAIAQGGPQVDPFKVASYHHHHHRRAEVIDRTFETRHRTSSRSAALTATQAQFLEDNSSFDHGSNNNNNEPSSSLTKKQKKSLNTSTNKFSKGNETSSTSAAGTSSKDKSRVKEYKSPQQMIAELMASDPNILLGHRNPDNDNPSLNYREAFQDCDSGEIYEGQWAYGARQGRGVCVYCDGLMYEGNWNRGKEHGKGELMTGDRRVIYSGDWVDGIMHGFGTYFFGNGDKYIGDWKEGNRHGRGDYDFANGCYYSGDWRDNKRHGKGRFTWADNSFYEGEWENDYRHGRGVIELSNGFRYDGFWCRNVLEGKGFCVFPSGQTYQGTFKNGFRDGRGSVQFAEGAVYEGRFKEDRFDGQGTLKINKVVPGQVEDELWIPIQMQTDLWRIHWKAGFGANLH